MELRSFRPATLHPARRAWLSATARRPIGVALALALVFEAALSGPALLPPPARAVDPPVVEPPPVSPTPDQAPPPTELVELRTADSRTLDNGDGTLTTEFYTDPVHYQPDGSSDWLPIDLGFETAASDLRAESDEAPVEVGVRDANDAAGFLEVAADEYEIAFRLLGRGAPGAMLPDVVADRQPSIDEMLATYTEVLPGVDLQVHAGAEAAKTFIVLKTADAASEFTFAVDAPGLSLQPADDGRVDFVDEAGEAVGRIPQPYAVDSSVHPERGGGAMTDQVTLAVGEVEGQPTVTIGVDPDWLAKATYPVYLDPTTIFTALDANEGDAFVSQAYPSQNFGDYVRPDSPFFRELWLGMDPSNSANVNEVYVKFDLTSIADVAIDSATLRVFPYHQYYNAPTATTTWLNRVNSAWNESTITWNNRNGSTALTSANLVEYEPGDFSVTSTVQSWVNGSVTNNGFKLHENGNGATYWKRLIAAEQGGGDVPELSVTYHRPVADAAPHNWSASRTRSWTYSDPHAQSHYAVEVSSNSSFTSIIHASGTVAGSGTSYTIPGTVALTSGNEYWWRVKVKDGAGWSTWDASSFIYDASVPTGTISINDGAASTNSGAVKLSLAGSDPGTSAVYANDGRSLTSIAAGCGSVTCGSWASPQLATDRSHSAIAVVPNPTQTSAWNSVTVDANATLRSTLAMDIRRDDLAPINVGLVSDDNDGFRLELYAGGATNTQLKWTETSTPGAYTSGTVSLPFNPDTWYRVVITSTGPTYNVWWYERSTPQPATPSFAVTGVYLPKPRLHVFVNASATFAGGLWLDDVKVTQAPATAPLGSGVTGVRFSVDGTSWGAWQGYRDTATYVLPAGSGTKTLYAQLRDGAGNVSATLSDAIEVAFDNLGAQAQHRLETWDLGAGDAAAVNVATGNLVLTHPLVSLPYRGGNVLPLTLTYNSLDDADVGLGAAWQLSLQRRLLLNPDGTVTFVDGDGARHTFTAPVVTGSTTTYTRPASLYATLVKDTSQANEFTLTYRDQDRDRFDLAGSVARLASVEDRHANAVSLAYDGAGNLQSATDPAGREVTFAWDTAASPDRLTGVTDWAWVQAGVVASAPSGAKRSYRFFYDAAGALAGWSDPLNPTGACPAGGSHLTCLGYTGGLLTSITKTQTATTLVSGALGTATRPATTSFTYAGSRVASVADAESRATTFSPDFADRVSVRRPATTTTYGLEAAADAYGRVRSVWRQADALTDIEQRTTWNATYPIEPATVTDNASALQSTPSRSVSYSYQPSSPGLVSRVVEPLNPNDQRWTDYAYNANNDVTQTVVSLEGSATQRTESRACYDAGCSLAGSGPNLLASVDNYVAGGPSNNDTNVRTDYAYDAYGQRTRVTRQNRDATGALLDDRQDRFSFDAFGNLTAEIVNYADGAVTSPGDDVTPDATTLARTDLTTIHTYDTAGNRVSTADPRRWVEAAQGTTLAADDFVTRWSFDPLDQQVEERTPTTPGVDIAQKTALSAYDESGALRWSSDFGGLRSATLYDRTGVATATYEHPADATARQTSATTLDPAGRPATAKDERQLQDAALGQTAWAYDRLGREIAVAQAVGSSPDVASETDSLYDALDRQISLEVGAGSPASLLTTYAHDLGGRITETDDGFTCARDTFDYRDRSTSTVSGLQGNGCAAGVEQRTISHTYDGLGRLVRDEVTAGPGTGDRTVDDSYDAAGNRRTSASRKAGVTETTSFELNPLDEVAAEARPDGSLAKNTYDPAGNAADRCFWRSGSGDVCLPVGSSWSVDAPDQVTTTTYDARNQRISLRNGASNGETTYDPDHNYQIKAIYTPTANGRELQTLFSYDARHRAAGAGAEDPAVVMQVCSAGADHVCSGTPVVVGSDVYAYDDNDSRTRVKEYNGATTSDRRYCYDARNQLTHRNTGAACSASAFDERFEYDDAGNRTTATAGGSTTAFSYDDKGRLTAAGGSPVTYDSAGRTKTYLGWFFEYDAEGRLLRACKSTSCAGSGFERLAFTYDGEGHRTQISATAAGGTLTTTDFRYQGDAVVEERVNGAVAKSFVVDEAGAIVKMTIPSGANAGDYLVVWNGRGDAMSLLRVKADGSTELANSFTYSTWGTPTIDGSHPNSANAGAAYGDLGFRYLYVGEFDVQWDNAFGLGLHYMHARHYAPALGRFLQPDPDGLEDSLYAYAANSPVTEIDPDGTCFVVCLVVGAVIDTAVYVATAENATIEGAIGAVAVGAVESAINPFAKVSRVLRVAQAANRVRTKVPTLRRTAPAVTYRGGAWRTPDGRFASNPHRAPSPRSAGRAGKQQRLRELGADALAPRHVRGWIRQEQVAIGRGNRTTIRVPPTYELAHGRATPARLGYGYRNSRLQNISVHRIQTRYQRR